MAFVSGDRSANGRNSFWVRTFELARRTGGQWHRVQRYYTKSTAAQVTSDISNAHRRNLVTLRTKGILPGEVWEAQWNQAPDGPNGDHEVWIRLSADPAGSGPRVTGLG